MKLKITLLFTRAHFVPHFSVFYATPSKKIVWYLTNHVTWIQSHEPLGHISSVVTNLNVLKEQELSFMAPGNLITTDWCQ